MLINITFKVNLGTHVVLVLDIFRKVLLDSPGQIQLVHVLLYRN